MAVIRESPARITLEHPPEVIAQYPIGDVPGKIDKGIDLPVPKAKGMPVLAKKADYPTHLTQEQYERDWKPQGWKIIYIGPTATWREEWGNWEAIREIVQNALDESESYDYGYDTLGFYIRDTGRGVGVSDFLLGPPKLKPEWSRGKYGEGMKIAGLALVRAGYPVYVETVGRQLFIIFLEQETDRRYVDTLAAMWKEGGTHEGTIFHIIGYQGDDYDDRFAVNLPKSAIIVDAPSTVTKPHQRYNQLIRYKFDNDTRYAANDPRNMKSRVYARDIFMTSIDSPYSYNLWGFDLAPDRHAPRNEREMWEDAGRTWAFVNDAEHLEVLFTMIAEPPMLQTPETNNLCMNWLGDLPPEYKQSYHDIMVANKDTWVKAWNAVFGEGTVLKTDSRWDATVKHLGYSSQAVSYSTRDGIAKVIKSDKELIFESQEKLREVQIVPDKELSDTQLANLGLLREVAQRVVNWNRIGGLHAAIIPPASDRVRTAGLYGRRTQEIFISTEQLNGGRQAIDTCIHELAHHTSGAEDGEPKHYEEVSKLAGKVVELVARQYFDKQLKNPAFAW